MKLLSSSSRGRACGKAGAGRQPRQQALSLQGRPSLALSRTTSSSQLCSSHNGRLELALGGTAATDVQAAAADAAGGLEQQAYDVIGLAQAMVDLSAAVDDGLLAQLGVERGSRRCVGGLVWCGERCGSSRALRAGAGLLALPPLRSRPTCHPHAAPLLLRTQAG